MISGCCYKTVVVPRYASVYVDLPPNADTPRADAELVKTRDSLIELTTLIVNHTWMKWQARVEKRFADFMRLATAVHLQFYGKDVSVQDRPNSALTQLKSIEMLMVTTETLKRIRQTYSSTSIVKKDVEDLYKCFHLIQHNVDYLFTDPEFKVWASREQFPYETYLRELSTFASDIRLLHRLVRSPKYRATLDRDVVVTSLPAGPQQTRYYPCDHNLDKQAWLATFDFMLKAVNDNRSQEEKYRPWQKIPGALEQELNCLKPSNVDTNNMSTKQRNSARIRDKAARKDKAERDLEHENHVASLDSEAAKIAYLANLTTDNPILSKAKKTERVHSEMKVIAYILEQPDVDEWFTGIGVSKLCCRSCFATIAPLNKVTGRRFHVLGSHLKTYGNVKYPDFTTLTEPEKKKVVVETFVAVAKWFIERSPAVFKRMLTTDFDSESERTSSDESLGMPVDELRAKMLNAARARYYGDKTLDQVPESKIQAPEDSHSLPIHKSIEHESMSQHASVELPHRRTREESESEVERLQAEREGSPNKKVLVENLRPEQPSKE